MQDMITKGTGNSRLLKSVSDFMTLYPTYEDFAAALIAGTLPVDFNGLNAEGIAQQGTPLNKANLLSDATAALFGGNSSSTPNDILSQISNRIIRFGTCSTDAATAAKTVSVTGTFSLAAGMCVRVLFTKGNTAASPTLKVNNTDAKAIQIASGKAAGDGAWIAGEVVDFVYTGSAWVMESIHGHVTIETGSYIGTDTYGSSNQNSLTFGLYPLLVIINGYSGNGHNSYGIAIRPMTDVTYFRSEMLMLDASSDSFGNHMLDVKFTDTGISWYDNSFSTPRQVYTSNNSLTSTTIQRYVTQLNYKNTTYTYVAIGLKQ